MTDQNSLPTEPLADDGVGWNRFDKLMLLLLAPFLAYVGAMIGDGWTGEQFD